MTGEPKTRYDAKCREWERFYILGCDPTTAALVEAGQWQLVYELRPLELIPYWLGIPFRPFHPVYAVIYDPVNRGYYTAPAAKIRDLGKPELVRGAVPFARIADLSVPLGRLLRIATRLLMEGAAAIDRNVRRLEVRMASWKVTGSAEVKP